GVAATAAGVDRGPCGAVEAAGPECGEQRFLRLLGRAHHRPREAAVEAGVVRVVGGKSEVASAALERLVPVEGRIAPADLELAAGVPYLDAEQAGARLPLLGAEAAPVRVCEIGDAAVRIDPRHDFLQRGELVLRDLRVGVDAEGENVR